MAKICPNPECKAEFDDNMKFCPECGSRLEDKTEEQKLVSIGDANAISGGVHIDNSKTVDSHDVHYHTIKNEKETALELNARYQKEVIALCPNGVVSTEARIKLDSLKLQLGIADDVANQIEDNIRKAALARAKNEIEQLSPAARIVLNEAVGAIENNSQKACDYIEKLAGLRKLTNDDCIDFYYNMLLAAFDSETLIEQYEKHDTDSYWRTFWTCIAFRMIGNKKQAEISLSELQVLWNERPKGDVVLNMCVGILWDNDGMLDKCKDKLTKYIKECNEKNTSELLFNLHSGLEWLVDDNKNASKELYKGREINHDDDYPLTVFYRQYIIPSTKDSIGLYKLALQYSWDHDPKMFCQEIIAGYEKAAKYGSCQAMVELGDIYGEKAERFGLDEYDKSIEEKKINWKKKAVLAGNNLSAIDLYYEYKDTNKQDAIKWLEMAAEREDNEAGLLLATEYSNLDGSFNIFTTYHEQAAFLYKDVISKDKYRYGAEAKFGLGKLYLVGKGVEKDEVKALGLIKEAADYGDESAMDFLGCCYMNGTGVVKDYDKAIDIFQRAIEEGSDEALIHLGQCYLKLGDKEDYHQKAYESFVKATQLPSYKQTPSAHDWLGYCYCCGYGVGQDFQKAVSCFSHAAKMYENKNEMPSPTLFYHMADLNFKCKKIETAKDWFIKAAEAGNAESMWRLACLHSNGYLKKDIKTADSWLKRAAEAGHEEARKRMASHGTMLEENATSSIAENNVTKEEGCGEGGTTNNEPQFAKELYNEALRQDTIKLRLEKMPEAAEAGSAEAMLYLAKAYISGVGVKRNENTARVWCKSAVDAGSAEASELLSAIEDSSYTVKQVALNYEESQRKYNCAFTNKGKTFYPAKIKSAAEDGSVDAMLFLAKHYRDGKGSYAMDSALARQWFQKAAYCGSDEARIALGMPVKKTEQSSQFTGSANSTNVKGDQNASATISSTNLERAQKLYDAALNEQTLSVRISRMEKAAKAGSPDAMLFMAKAYISGVKINRNERTAIDYCNKAIAMGQKEASKLLQAIKDNSYTPEQVAINHEESYYKYKESFSKGGYLNRSRMKHAAEGGSVDAMLFLAKAYRDGTYEYEADEQYSRMWFQKAAHCGSNEARKVLGIVSENSSSQPQTIQNNAPLRTIPQSKTVSNATEVTERRKKNTTTPPVNKIENKSWWQKSWFLKIVLALACIASLCVVIFDFASSQIFYAVCLWVAYLYLRIKAKKHKD